MNKIKNIFLVLYFAAIWLIISCTTGNTTLDEAQETKSDSLIAFTYAQQQTAKVEIGRIQRKQIKRLISANGYLKVYPTDVVSVSLPFDGNVKSIHVVEGMQVNKGMLLAMIENPEFIQLQQDFLEAFNQLDYAFADYERQEQLAKENVNAQKTLQLSKATYLNWFAKLKALEAKLKLFNIQEDKVKQGLFTAIVPVYAKIDGVVTEVNVNVGKSVMSSDNLFQIVNTNRMYVELKVFENDFQKLRVNQKVWVKVASESEERMATIKLINKKINEDRTLNVLCEFVKVNKSLTPGSFVNAKIETEVHETEVLPSHAIADFQGKKYMFQLVKQDKDKVMYFKMIEVKIGFESDNFVEVLLPANFTTDANLVTNGAYSILSKVMNAE